MACEVASGFPDIGMKSSVVPPPLSNNDTAVIAQANGVQWAVNGLVQLFGTPLAGALSDSIGRKPLWALGRCTKILWFMGSMYATNMNAYIVACVLAWGLGDCGTLSV